MVRICQVEDQLAAYFDGLVSKQMPVQVGLLVGRSGGASRDLLLAAIPTPHQDGAPACTATAAISTPPSTSKSPKSGGKGKVAGPQVAVQLAEGWVCEHAHQVARMLPGGLSVLGAYLFAPDSGYQSAVTSLCGILEGIAGASTAAVPGAAADVLLLHASSTNRKLALRSASAASALSSSSLSPCELKVVPCCSNLIGVSCKHQVDISLPLPCGGAALQHHLQKLLNREAQRLQHCMCVVGGCEVPSDSAPLQEALPQSSKEAAVEVQLYCTNFSAGSTSGRREPQAAEVQGFARLRGCIQGLAYVGKREPFGRAVAALKADIQATLHTRVLLLLEEADMLEGDGALGAEVGGGGEPNPQQQQQQQEVATSRSEHALLRSGPHGKSCAVQLPRRALFEWQQGLTFCDHMLADETADGVADRARELLCMKDVTCSQVILPEAIPEVVPPSSSTAQAIAGKPGQQHVAGASASQAGVQAAVQGFGTISILYTGLAAVMLVLAMALAYRL